MDEINPNNPKAKVTVINNVDKVEDRLYYPFADMKPGQGFFLPNEPAQTTDQAFDKMHSHIVLANNMYAEVECDENGDEVWEEVVIKSRKRGPDGRVLLESSGNPVLGHDPVVRPKLIRSRRYAVRKIAIGDDIGGKKSEADGILVIRSI